jgi:hypothetical protein
MGKPDAPDPYETGAAQTATNIGTAIAGQQLDMVNQVTPDGNLTYEQTGTRQYTDPVSGAVYDLPTYTSTQTLSDDGQRAYDANSQTKINLAELGQQQSGFFQDYMAKPVDLSSDNIGNYINDHFGDDFDAQWSKNSSSLENRLASQGIQMGSAAYDRAMSEFNTSRGNAHDNMQGNLYSQAQNAILTERNQPLNEITALMSGSQIGTPNFQNTPGANLATTDYAGLINNNYAQEMGAYNDTMGGLFGLGSALIMSDERTKENVEKVGKTDDGQNIYSYNYKTGGPRQIGLMAQEVEKKKPDAVTEVGGIKMVDYGKALS